MVLCTLALMKQKVTQGCFWYIVASTFKIGPIFFLPAILLILAKMRGLPIVALFIITLISMHALIAIPFIRINAEAYFG